MLRALIVTLTASFAMAFPGVADSPNTHEDVTTVTTRAGESTETERSAVVDAEPLRGDAVVDQLLIVGGTPDGEVTPFAVASYRGRVAKGATLTMNGESVPIEKLGFWSVEVPLDVGENIFTFVATGASGATATVARTVTHDPSLLLSHPRTATSFEGKSADELSARTQEQRDRR